MLVAILNRAATQVIRRDHRAEAPSPHAPSTNGSAATQPPHEPTADVERRPRLSGLKALPAFRTNLSVALRSAKRFEPAPTTATVRRGSPDPAVRLTEGLAAARAGLRLPKGRRRPPD